MTPSRFLSLFRRPPKGPTTIHEVSAAEVPSPAAEKQADHLSSLISANIARSLRRSIEIKAALAEEQLLALKGDGR